MKECKYCGSLYADNLTSCPNCGGSKIVTAQEKMEEAVLQQKEIENRERAVAEPEVKKKKMFVAVAAILVIIVAVIGIVSYNANKPLSNGMSKAKGEELLAEGIAYYDAGNYEAAIECFGQLPIDSEQYEKAQAMLEKSADAYSARILEKADSYLREEEYEVALELLKQALVLLPDNADLKNSYTNAYEGYKSVVCATAIGQAEEYRAKNDYVNAIVVLRAALEKIQKDVEMEAKLKVYEADYREQMLTEADATLSSAGYQQAIAVLNTGLSVLVGDSILIEKIELYKTYAPIEIMEMETFSGDNTANVMAVTDTLGNEYSHTYVVSTNYGTDEFAVLLNGDYTKLSGTIIWSKEDKNNSGYYTMLFYEGDRLIYSSNPCSATSGPIIFSCDISNVNILTVKFDAFSTDGPFDQNIASLTVQK